MSAGTGGGLPPPSSPASKPDHLAELRDTIVRLALFAYLAGAGSGLIAALLACIGKAAP